MQEDEVLKIAIAETSMIVRSGLALVLKRIQGLKILPIELVSEESLDECVRFHKPEILIVNPSFTGYFDVRKFKETPQNAGVTVINVLPMEEYLYGVVPSESVPTWKPNALRAQAVAARTYALKHKNGFKSRGFDVTDTTESQVYNGYSAETKATNDAVDSTAGEIITYNGQPIDAVFSASAGGYTENSENVWGQVIPYLRGVKEEDTPEVKQAWTSKVSLDTLQKNLGIGNLQEIRLSRLTSGPMFTGDRGVSGRVKRIIFVGSNGQKTITGDNFRRLFGLKSTMFDFDIEGNTLMIYGYGWGH